MCLKDGKKEIGRKKINIINITPKTHTDRLISQKRETMSMEQLLSNFKILLLFLTTFSEWRTPWFCDSKAELDQVLLGHCRACCTFLQLVILGPLFLLLNSC